MSTLIPTGTDVDTPEAEDVKTNTSSFPVGKELSVLAVIVGLVFGTAIMPKFFTRVSPEPSADQLATLPYTDDNEHANVVRTIYSDPYESVLYQAEAVAVYDVHKEQFIYTDNAEEVMPLASVTKLMTILVAYEILESTDLIEISEAAFAQYGNSGLVDGESFTARDLSDLTIISSSNDGAYALAVAAGEELVPGDGANAFIEAMNIRATDIGLTDTVFVNPTGLDENTIATGGLGTARDMSLLMAYIAIHYPEILEITKSTSVSITNTDGATHEAANTNQRVNNIPGLIGSKTGFTDLAGGNLTIAYDAGLNRPIVITVLGSSRSARFSDVEALVSATDSHLTQTLE